MNKKKHINKKEHINKILELVDRSRTPVERTVDFSLLRTLLNKEIPKQLALCSVVVEKRTFCEFCNEKPVGKQGGLCPGCLLDIQHC